MVNDILGLKLCRHCTGHHVCEATRKEGHEGHERSVRLKDDDRDEVLDLMRCVRGNEDGLHANRIRRRRLRRNRDKNASRNIWEVLHAMVEGLPTSRQRQGGVLGGVAQQWQEGARPSDDRVV